MRIRDLVKPGSGMEKVGSGILAPGWKRSDPGFWLRDKYPGSATLLLGNNITYIDDNLMGKGVCLIFEHEL
jgi:hypothetical protein